MVPVQTRNTGPRATAVVLQRSNATADPAAEIVPWTGFSLLMALAGLFLFVAFPGGERAQAAELRVGPEAELEVVHALADLRRAIVAYRADHGVWPAQELVTRDPAQRFEAELLDSAPLAAPGPDKPLAAYLSGAGLPRNPVNGLSTVRVLGTQEPLPLEPDDRTAGSTPLGAVR